MKIISISILLIALFSGGGYVLNESWTSLNALGIAYHGKIALMLGVIVTFLMSAGLMFLVFYSNRRGYDAENYKPRSLPLRK